MTAPGHLQRFDSAREVSGAPPIASEFCAPQRELKGQPGQALSASIRARRDACLVLRFALLKPIRYGTSVDYCVIPGRHEVSSPRTHEHRPGLWVPGSRLCSRAPE